MRKIVYPIVLMLLFIGISACENQPEVITKTSPKQVKSNEKVHPDTVPVKVHMADTVKVVGTIPAAYPVKEGTEIVEEKRNDSIADIPPDTAVAFAKIDSVQPSTPPDSTLAFEAEPDSDFVDPGEVEESYSEQGHYTESGLNLNKERLVQTEILNVYRPDYRTEYDSTLSVIEKRISLHPDEVSKKVVVERWISPVNYRGYKFNRKKLMLYGVDKEAPVSIFYYIDTYYFSLRKHVYNLSETNNNTAFTVVSDSLVENHLLDYEPQL